MSKEHVVQYDITIVKKIIGGAEIEKFVADSIIPHDIQRFKDYCNVDMMVSSVQIRAQRFMMDDSDSDDEEAPDCEACRITIPPEAAE